MNNRHGRSFERLLFYVEEAHWYYEARLLSLTSPASPAGRRLSYCSYVTHLPTAVALCHVGTMQREQHEQPPVVT